MSIKRSTHLKREVSYNSFTNSMLPTVFNGDFDRIWHTLQEQSYKLGQYDFDYSYAVNISNQANQKADQANQKADLALEGLETVSTETQPILRGGTGATTAEDARNNLDVYSQTEVDALIATGGSGNIVGIENGGTGADTAEDARNNLDVYSQTEVDTAIASAIPPAIPNATETTAGKAKIATTAIAQAGTNDADFLTAKKLRDALNASGVLPIYALRSWGIVQGTAIPARLVKGANIASVVDEGIGQYKITFATPMPDLNYGVLFGSTTYTLIDAGTYGTTKIGTKTVNGFIISCGQQNYVDVPEVSFGVIY